MNETLLSIMLPTTVDRRPHFYRLLEEITSQLAFSGLYDKVELLIDEDEKQKSIGKKRQDLLERAIGEFVVGIDSDDFIARGYIGSIIYQLIKNPDVDHVGFIERCLMDGKESKSIFSIRYSKWAENVDGWDHIRCANPKSVIRRTKALQVGFEDIRYGEDKIFSEAVTPLLKTESFINQELYFYNYTTTNSNERYGIK